MTEIDRTTISLVWIIDWNLKGEKINEDVASVRKWNQKKAHGVIS
ncbi:hypothetical protein [Dysgonomonas sp. ZJ709]|nr:hypothetical protein [Dysgonomonas sp. ZJ709]